MQPEPRFMSSVRLLVVFQRLLQVDRLYTIWCLLNQFLNVVARDLMVKTLNTAKLEAKDVRKICSIGVAPSYACIPRR